MMRVLIAEDSATARQLLISILEMDAQMQVCGVAVNGLEAVTLARRLRPNVILMDIQMPLLNGFQATKLIMSEQPTPIVVVSGHRDVSEISVAIEALRAGALTVLPKPRGAASPRFQRDAEHLLATIRAMSEVAVVRRRVEPSGKSLTGQAQRNDPDIKASAAVAPRRRVELVVAAASTGGPAALHQILSELPADFAPPILIAQHLSPGFISGLASSLGRTTPLKVKVAHHLDALEPNTVYLAQHGRHLVVEDHKTLALAGRREHDRFCPSADALFESAAKVFGAATLALVLTGMGNDGTQGAKAVSAAGGEVIAQDESSSIIFGMPKEAIASGAVRHVLPLSAIAPFLAGLR